MHKEYILLNGFRKAKKGFTAGFHVPPIHNQSVVTAITSVESDLSAAFHNSICKWALYTCNARFASVSGAISVEAGSFCFGIFHA